MAPSFASELWSGFQSATNRLSTDSKDYNFSKSVLEQSWPEVDLDYCLDLVCQTNGCENAIIKVPRKELEQMSYDTAVNLAMNESEVQKFLVDREIDEIKFEIYEGYEGVVNIITKRKKEVLAQ